MNPSIFWDVVFPAIATKPKELTEDWIRTLEIENTYGAKLWLERIFCLGMFIFAIFCGFNYLNVQNILPLCKSKNRFLHYVGIILLDVAVIFALFVIMFIIESVAFPIN